MAPARQLHWPRVLRFSDALCSQYGWDLDYDGNEDPFRVLGGRGESPSIAEIRRRRSVKYFPESGRVLVLNSCFVG